jgi:O-antigen/teichoic acid export membrane protein
MRCTMEVSLRRIAANTGWLLGGKGVGAVLSLFYIGIATRTLGLDGFGHFALIVGIGQTVTGLVTFQTWQLVVRYGAALREDPDRGALHGLVRFAMRLDLASAAVGSAVAVGAIIGLAPVFGWSTGMQRQAAAFCVALLLAIRSTPIGILRLHDLYARSAVADVVTPVVRLGGALLALAAGWGVAGFLLAWAAAELATAAAYWMLALRAEPLRFGAGRASARTPGMWRFVLATNASATIALSSRQLILLGVGLVAGPAAAGGYRIAAQLSQALAKLTAAVSRAVFPELARRLHDAAPGEMRRLAARVTGASLAAGMLGVAIAVLAGRPLVRAIAGAGFEAAYGPIVLLTIAAAIDLAAVAFEPVLVAAGRAGRALGWRVVATVVQIAALALLATTFGAIGAAWATVLGSGVAAVVLGMAASRVLGRGSLERPAARHGPARLDMVPAPSASMDCSVTALPVAAPDAVLSNTHQRCAAPASAMSAPASSPSRAAS